MRLIARVCGVLLAVSACGGGTTDVRTRSGSTVFAGTSAYFAVGTLATSGEPTTERVFILEVLEAPDGCGPHAGVSPYAGAVLGVWLRAPAGDSMPTGRYQITRSTSDSEGWAAYSRSPMLLAADSGEVELESLSSSAARGTVDLTLQDGTRVGGEFFASPCS